MLKKEIIVEKDRKISNLLQDFGFSFADVNKILRNKDVRVNGRATKEDEVLHEGELVTFFYTPKMLEKKLDVLFEDDDVFVVYKSAGIESDGEKGAESVLKGAIAVHRLDRNTEGLMIFAKNVTSEQKLLSAFKKDAVHKHYLAEVVGRFEADQVFDAYLLKDSQNSFVKIFKKNVKDSVKISTKIKTIKAGAETSLVEVELLTGKTHQIRAHLAYIGHPIVGDGKYGKNEINKKFKQNRQKLACFKLKFDYVGCKGIDFKEFEKLPKWAN